MKENVYTIKKLCAELDQPRQKVRRRLIKLDIKAVNEKTRTYKNEPLEYDKQAFLKLAEEFNILINEENRTASVQHRTTKRTTNVQDSTEKNDDKDKLIEVLEEQLKETNRSKANLENLLDQQQQLTLISNRENDTLKLKLEEEKGKNKWWQFWK